MPDPAAVVAQQVYMYGEPLGVRFGRLLHNYGLSQARLAAVIGLSPPMLSQLMSGQRAKISNPSVLGRVVRLEELARTDPEHHRDEDAVAALLAEVAASRPALSTQLVRRDRALQNGLDEATEVLARLFDRATLMRAADQVDEPRLRQLFHLAAAAAADRMRCAESIPEPGG